MKRNIYAVAVLVTQIFAFSNFAAASAADDGIKFRMALSGIIVVPVRLNGGEPIEFVLDTGATTTTLTGETARRLGLAAINYAEVDTPTGTISMPHGVVSHIIVGGMSTRDVRVYWADLPVLKRIAPKLGGILGQNFLRQFNFEIDLEGKRLRHGLNTPAGFRVPVEITGGRLVIDIESAGARLRLGLDSGASDLFLFASGCRKLEGRIRNAAPGAAVTAKSESQIRSGLLNEMTIGETTLRELAVGLLQHIDRPIDGLLPLNLFRAVYFDNRNGYLVLQPRADRL